MKKSIVTGFLIFFVFSIGIIADEIPKVVKQLVYAQTPPLNWGFEYYPTNYMVDEVIGDETTMTFSVPALTSGREIFFETWTTTDIRWTTWNNRVVGFGIWLRVISPIIPNGIELELGIGCANHEERNAQGYIDFGFQRFPRCLKYPLRRDSVGVWRMYYKDPFRLVPEEIAIQILNDLINNGFDVEVNTQARGDLFTKSTIQGAEFLKLHMMVEVTGVPGN